MTEQKEKTHWKKEFNYNYLGSYSLSEGKDRTVTIKQLKKEEVSDTNGKKSMCLVCYFTDSDKPMILNKTNCKTIERLYGTAFIEDWLGKKINLYSAKVKAFGEITEGLRIRDVKPLEIIDNTKALEAIEACKTLAELQTAYMSLSKAEQADPIVIKLKNNLKTQLQ